MFKRFSTPVQAMGAAVLLSVAALGAYAQQTPPAADAKPPRAERGERPDGPGRFGPGHGPMLPGGPMLDRHLLKEVGATDAQRKQIKDIFEAARTDLKAQHEQGRQLHEQIEALFAAPTVDAAAIERVRAQIAAQHEAGSKRLTQAMIDAAKVLTPEQRAKVAELIKKHKARMEERMKHMKERGEHGPRGERGGDHGDMPPPPPAR